MLGTLPFFSITSGHFIGFLLSSVFFQHSKYTLLLLLSPFSRVRLCATPWTAAHQAPLQMGWQEYWGGVPLPSLEYTLVYLSYLNGFSYDL